MEESISSTRRKLIEDPQAAAELRKQTKAPIWGKLGDDAKDELLGKLCDRRSSESIKEENEKAAEEGLDKATLVKTLESSKVMQALKAATGTALRLRPGAFSQTASPDGSGMPGYPDVVEIFGEGLLPHTLLNTDGLVTSGVRAKAPPFAAGKPKLKALYDRIGKPAVVQGGSSICSLAL